MTILATAEVVASYRARGLNDEEILALFGGPKPPRKLRTPSPRSIERRNEVVSLRASGLTYQEVGDKLGISRERVRQILLAAGSDNLVGHSFGARRTRQRTCSASEPSTTRPYAPRRQNLPADSSMDGRLCLHCFGLGKKVQAVGFDRDGELSCEAHALVHVGATA